MHPLYLNYIALLSTIFDTKLSCDKALKREGIELNRIVPEIDNRRIRKLSDDYAAEISDLYWDKNWTITELARKYGYSQPHMSRYMKANNIAIRAKGAAVGRFVEV